MASSQVATERHFSISEVASMWGLSERTIRRMLDNQPGVVVWGNIGDGKTKRRTKVRIPESVLSRIHSRLRRK